MNQPNNILSFPDRKEPEFSKADVDMFEAYVSDINVDGLYSPLQKDCSPWIDIETLKP